MKRLKRSTWNTYYLGGYTHNATGDQASAGGVLYYEVRRHGSRWQRRITQSNGRHESRTEPEAIAEDEGERLFAEAKSR